METLLPYPDPFEDELLKVQDTCSSTESGDERTRGLDDVPCDEFETYVDWDQCIQEVSGMYPL